VPPHADDPLALEPLRAALAAAGDPVAGFPDAPVWRALGALRRGALAEAEASAREDEGALARGVLAEALLGRGDGEGAATVLEQAPRAVDGDTPATHAFAIQGRARVLLSGGGNAGAADLLQAWGEHQARWPIAPPALVPWEPTLGLALAVQGDRDAGVLVAIRAVHHARAYARPEALGVALRLGGTLAGPDDGLPVLQEAVDVLTGTGAQLELARAHAELGSALRRRGQRPAAHRELTAAFDLAQACGGVPVADRAQRELTELGTWRMRR
jgi:hypothetical protein